MGMTASNCKHVESLYCVYPRWECISSAVRVETCRWRSIRWLSSLTSLCVSVSVCVSLLIDHTSACNLFSLSSLIFVFSSKVCACEGEFRRKQLRNNQIQIQEVNCRP